MTQKFKISDRVHVIRDSKIEIDTIIFKDGTIYQLQDKSWVEDCRLAPAPALVVIPHDVRDEIVLSLHYHEHDKEKALKYMLKLYYRNPELYDESVRKWIEGNFTQFISAFLVGYTTVEVEKEPLYYVKVLNRGLGYLNCDTGAGEYFIDSRNNDDGIKTQYTETEIKALNEKLWECAVPVEEEAE
ncbi:DUF1642 domain-containing protein [Listeria booriae]|uniref:DUF1642 domain-containing protein n=1 Tax=Listeria booriae TaxID=1552123 RepID=UPI00164DEA03|nr:DUF1642 domain-containing protein [Listeria booriae]MBC6150091.1 DUF1642 domain-containing protein [Listeria booriae]